MAHLDLDIVLARLEEASAVLSDLLGDTRGHPRLERALASVDLMVASGVRDVHQGRRVDRSPLVVLGAIRGYTHAAIGNLESLLVLDVARPHVRRLQDLVRLLRAAAEEPAAEVAI